MWLDVEFGEVWSGMVMWAVKCSGVLSWKIESLDLLGSLKIRGRLSMGLFWWLIPDLQLWMLIIVYHQTSIEEIINRLLINGCKKLAQLYPSLSHQ